MYRLFIVVITLCVFATGAETFWVPVAAHLVGVGGSVWRTDLALHNGCDQDAAIQITCTALLEIRANH